MCADAQVLEALERLDARTAGWHAARGRTGLTWSQSVARAFSRPAGEHLGAYYESKGAELR